MSNDAPHTTKAPEPYFGDPGNLTDVAMWVINAVVTGVLGNAAYDFLKSVVKRHGFQRFMAEIRERLAERPDVDGMAPRQIEERVEQALQQSERERQ